MSKLKFQFSYLKVFQRKAILNEFGKFPEVQEPFFSTVVGCNFTKKGLRHGCLPGNIAKFIRGHLF